MKKKSMILIILFFAIMIFSSEGVKGEDALDFYPRLNRFFHGGVIPKRIPTGTIVIGNRGYSIEELQCGNIEDVLKTDKRIFFKESEDRWIDHRTQEEVDKSCIPEVEFLNQGGELFVFEKGDGKFLKEKWSKGIFFMHIEDKDNSIGNVIRVSGILREGRRYLNAQTFSIESCDGKRKIENLNICETNYTVTKVEDITIDNKVNIVLYDYRNKKMVTFENVEIENERIILTYKNEIKRKEIYVTNEEELVDAIGPNRDIILKKGEYNVSEIFNIVDFSNMVDLTIKGEDTNERPHLIFDPNNQNFTLWQAKKITFMNLKIESKRKGISSRDYIIDIQRSEEVKIDNCELLSHGAKVLNIDGAKNVQIKNSVIRGGESGMVDISRSRHISLENCVVKDNVGKKGIDADECEDVLIKNTVFENNDLSGAFFNFTLRPYSGENAKGLMVSECIFKGNNAEILCEDKGDKNAIFESNKFNNNIFKNK